ncbi:MAG: hypothetical protein WCP35_09315 [Verrucomicrobiota bacterium]
MKAAVTVAGLVNVRSNSADDCKLFELAAGNFPDRFLTFFAADHQPLADRVECNADLAAFDFRAFEDWPAANQVGLAEILGQRPQGEAIANINLVRWMEAVGLTKIRQHHQASIFNAAMTLELGQADARPSVAALGFSTARITGELDDINREIALLPSLAPTGDESPQLGQIDLSIVVAVGFTLIPNQAFESIGDQALGVSVNGTKVRVGGIGEFRLDIVGGGYFSIKAPRSQCGVFRSQSDRAPEWLLACRFAACH